MNTSLQILNINAISILFCTQSIQLKYTIHFHICFSFSLLVMSIALVANFIKGYLNSNQKWFSMDYRTRKAILGQSLVSCIHRQAYTQRIHQITTSIPQTIMWKKTRKNVNNLQHTMEKNPEVRALPTSCHCNVRKVFG